MYYRLWYHLKLKGLFHKAISQSGYTTSSSKKQAFAIEKTHPTFNHTSNEVVKRLIDNQKAYLQKIFTKSF